MNTKPEQFEFSNIEPDYNITFHKDEEEIGRLDWNDGVMKFKGEVEESAKIFFDYLKGLMDAYLKREAK